MYGSSVPYFLSVCITAEVFNESNAFLQVMKPIHGGLMCMSSFLINLLIPWMESRVEYPQGNPASFLGCLKSSVEAILFAMVLVTVD